MKTEIKQLLKRFVNNQCTASEIEEVRSILENGAYEAEWQEVIEEEALNNIIDQSDDMHSAFIDTDKLLKRIQHSAKIDHTIKTKTIRQWPLLKLAAVLLIALSAGILFYKQRDLNLTANLAGTSDTLKPDHKFITLPDGSTVLLNNLSNLDYSKDFTGNTREVTLSGEAYFDIKHDRDRPFIIHTGKLKTTVLGTAFNIRAYRNEKMVTVTVTRGKVKVEDDRQVLGVITPNQQIMYNQQSGRKKQLEINAESNIKWKKADLIIDDLTLEEAARMVSSQYNMNIKVSGKVKDCRFSANFLNRTPLQQVLRVVGEVTNTTYDTLADNTIIIEGDGCQ